MQTRFQWMLVHPAAIIAQGAGSGLLHPASGTWGTLIGWLFFSFISSNQIIVSPVVWAIFLAVTFIIGVWACHVTGKQLGVQDDSSIVFDEMWAIWLVMLFVMPAGLWWQCV
jgi:phosphatidylglycerophosphatase A